MKYAKGFRSFVVLLILFSSTLLRANDGTYYTRGNHLIPLQETDISVRHEVLTISLMDNGYARVDVQYEFWNPGKTVKRLLMGFEADPPYNDDYRFHPDGAHPNIRDFMVEMNGQQLNYSHSACVRDTLPLQLIDTTKHYFVWDNNALYETDLDDNATETDWAAGIAFSYVYYFEADFLPGLNRVHHTYTYRMSIAVGTPWMLDYKLSPAGRWAGGKIDDFTLVVRADSTAKHFNIFENAFPGAEPVVAEGTGKLRHNRLYNLSCFEVSLRNGAIKIHIVDFHPQEELSIQAIDIYGVTDGHYRLGYSYDRSSPMFLQLSDDGMTSDKDFMQRVAHNLPYAHRGHVFHDKRLKEYFESLWWYMPNPDYKDSTDDFTPVDWMFINADFK